MRPYEVMVIFDVGLEDGDINAGIDRITSLVRDRGGNPGAPSGGVAGRSRTSSSTAARATTSLSSSRPSRPLWLTSTGC